MERRRQRHPQHKGVTSTGPEGLRMEGIRADCGMRTYLRHSAPPPPRAPPLLAPPLPRPAGPGPHPPPHPARSGFGRKCRPRWRSARPRISGKRTSARSARGGGEWARCGPPARSRGQGGWGLGGGAGCPLASARLCVGRARASVCPPRRRPGLPCAVLGRQPRAFPRAFADLQRQAGPGPQQESRQYGSVGGQAASRGGGLRVRRRAVNS